MLIVVFIFVIVDISAVGAREAAESPSKIFWEKLVRFG